MTWGEFKTAVEAASVLDDDNVDDLSAMVNTDGCNCRLSELGEHPVTTCWEPEDHFVREITVAGLVALIHAEPRLEAVDFNARVFDVRPCPVLAPSR
jgi:hypothetical protein